MKKMKNTDKEAFTIVPFSSLSPSGNSRLQSDPWLVHDDGLVEEKNSFLKVRGRVEFSVNSVQGLVQRARQANYVEGVA